MGGSEPGSRVRPPGHNSLYQLREARSKRSQGGRAPLAPLPAHYSAAGDVDARTIGSFDDGRRDAADMRSVVDVPAVVDIDRQGYELHVIGIADTAPVADPIAPQAGQGSG